MIIVTEIYSRIESQKCFHDAVDFSYSEISDKEIVDFVRHFLNYQIQYTPANISLEKLILKKCKNVTENACDSLVLLLNHFPTLQYLDIEGTGIRDKGIKKICSALYKNNALEVLNLDKLGVFGLESVVSLLERTPSLKHISFALMALETSDKSQATTRKEAEIFSNACDYEKRPSKEEDNDEEEEEDSKKKNKDKRIPSASDDERDSIGGDDAHEEDDIDTKDYAREKDRKDYLPIVDNILTEKGLEDLIYKKNRNNEVKGQEKKIEALLNRFLVAMENTVSHLESYEIRYVDAESGVEFDAFFFDFFYPEISQNLSSCLHQKLIDIEKRPEHLRYSSKNLMQALMRQIQEGRLPGEKSLLPLRTFFHKKLWRLLSLALLRLYQVKKSNPLLIDSPQKEMAFLSHQVLFFSKKN